MAKAKSSEARAHHFAPQCWLAGFTDIGEKTGRLWVTDLKRKKQLESTPQNAGHRRDFYRASDPGLDPLTFEKQFSKIESLIAPLLKELYLRPRAPDRGELEDLLFFAALQYVRVPAFRPTILRISDSIYRAHFEKALQTPESWKRELKQAGIPLDSPGASYEEMVNFEREGNYTLSAENEWFLIRGLEVAARAIIPSLKARHWGTAISPNGNFIASDNPVVMDGPKEQIIGFKSAEIVIFPVNRHLLLYGTKVRVRARRVNMKLIAGHNTFAMLCASEHLYSHEPDFCWSDESGRCQFDWKLFSKEKIEAAIEQRCVIRNAEPHALPM